MLDKKIEKELLEDTRIEDLSELSQAIAELIGLENLLKLSHFANGTEIYISPPSAILKKARNRKIRSEYNGYNSKELSKKYGISEDHMKTIIKEYDPKQMNIFDVFDSDGKLKKP